MAHVVETAAGLRLEATSGRGRPVRLLGRFCREKPLGALGGLIVVVLIGMALLAHWIAPYDYDQTIRAARMKPPSLAFLMGTGNLGRGIFSRVIYAPPGSVPVGFGAALLPTPPAR